MENFRFWLSKSVGKRFLELECHVINQTTPRLFGYTAILVGEPNFNVCLQQSPIKNRIVLNEDPDLSQDLNSLLIIKARHDKLPIESGSVDLVYLSHAIEFSNNPHEVLREAYRVLRPDGVLLVSAFNKLGVWGLWRSIARIFSPVPWRSNFMSSTQLKDWLVLLGFDIMRVNYFGFNLPLNKSNYASRTTLYERYGQGLELPFGAAFVIEANKRVLPLTPITPAWRDRPDLVVDDAVEPTV